MPTTNPRMTVTLSTDLDRSLTAYAWAMKQSKGSIIVDALEQMVPVMDKLSAMAQAVERASPEVMQSLRARAGSFEAMLNGLASTVQSGMDLFVEAPARSSPPERSEGARSAGAVRRPKAPAPASPPPSPNRGVSSTPPKSKVTPIRGGRHV